jgi:hypothetical protein
MADSPLEETRTGNAIHLRTLRTGVLIRWTSAMGIRSGEMLPRNRRMHEPGNYAIAMELFAMPGANMFDCSHKTVSAGADHSHQMDIVKPTFRIEARFTPPTAPAHSLADWMKMSLPR